MARVVVLEGPITRVTARKIIAELRAMDTAAQAPIVLFICSGGGEVSAALAIADVMNSLPSPIYTLGIGPVMSAAALLLSNGEKGYRFVAVNAQVMVHQPRGGMALTESSMDFAIHTQERAHGLLAENCGKTLEEVDTALLEDNYLSAEQALAFGIADGIIDHNYSLQDYQ